MAAKKNAPVQTAMDTIDPTTPAEAGEQAAQAEATPAKEVKPLDEKTAKTREANAALREQVKDEPTLTLISPDDAEAYSTRFSDRVKLLDAPEGTDGQCWIWTGATDYDGYPVYVDKDGKRWMTARYAVSIATGEAPGRGSNLRHSCKRHLCVNPSHMLTQAPAALEQAELETQTAEQEVANS